MHKNILTVLVSSVISFFILEFLVRITIGHPLEVTNFSNRIMMFEKGENFQNINSYFKYYPNKNIISKTYYVDENVHMEYDYIIQTNNLGLVQNRDIDNSKKAEIIFGDSFTEGQGAMPWFYDFDNLAFQQNRNFINGGILGTGPMQWRELKEHLELEGIKFSTINAIIIGDDLNRNIWNFDEDTLQCLRFGDCSRSHGDFYGYDFANNTEEQTKTAAQDFYDKKNSSLDLKNITELKYNIKLIAKRSAAIFIIYRYIKENFIIPRTSNIPVETAGRDVHTKDLPTRVPNIPIEAVGRDVCARNLNALKILLFSGETPGFLILVTMKNEAGTPPQWSRASQNIIAFAKENNINLHTCILEKNDFHTFDSHPNNTGYAKLNACVSSAAGIKKQNTP